MTDLARCPVQRPSYRTARLHRLKQQQNRLLTPKVGAIGQQVVVHVPYTVTMPPTFGELFYARGGRVDIEMNHSHDVIVAEISLWWPHDMKEAVKEASVLATTTELAADPVIQGALARRATEDERPSEDALAWARGESWLDPSLSWVRSSRTWWRASRPWRRSQRSTGRHTE